jgi:sec-independent protein translocase protein TatA
MGLDNPIHIAFLLILLLLVFGAKRLPEMGRSLGQGMRGFKDAIGGDGSQATSAAPTSPSAAQQVAQPTPATRQQEPAAILPVAIPTEIHTAPVHTAEKLTA